MIPLRAPGGGAAPAAGGGKKRRASTSAGLTTAVGEDGTLDLSRSYNVRLQALNVLSLAFITSAEGEETGSAGPALAVLSTAPGGGKTLSSYILNLATKELDESTAALQETQLTDAGSENLVAVEGGVLVVGEESVTFFSVSPPKTADDGEGSPGKGKGKAVEKAGEKDGKSGKRVTAKMPVSRITACVSCLLSPFHPISLTFRAIVTPSSPPRTSSSATSTANSSSSPFLSSPLPPPSQSKTSATPLPQLR